MVILMSRMELLDVLTLLLEVLNYLEHTGHTSSLLFFLAVAHDLTFFFDVSKPSVSSSSAFSGNNKFSRNLRLMKIHKTNPREFIY